VNDDASDHLDAVERYYQRNTEAFLRLGKNDGVPAIHIALWPEGTNTLAEAMNVAHRLILERIKPLHLVRVADLGCGMGSALAYLDQHLSSEVELYGLTLGTPEIQNLDTTRIQIQHGDFHDSNALLPSCSAAFCIEAIAHSDNPAKFFDSAAGLLDRGGKLLIMDDVVMHTDAPSESLTTYRSHWLAPGVQPLEHLAQWADDAGFSLQHSQNLTPWIRLGRPRDHLIRWSRPLWSWLTESSEYAKSLSGGDARQRCLQTGETEFQLLEFVRR